MKRAIRFVGASRAKSKSPFGVAAISDSRKNPEGEIVASFAMLTVNADGHRMMGQFHWPDDEKRSVITVEHDSIGDWLVATTDQALTYFSPISAAEFTAVRAPKPSIARTEK